MMIAGYYPAYKQSKVEMLCDFLWDDIHRNDDFFPYQMMSRLKSGVLHTHVEVYSEENIHFSACDTGHCMV